MTIEEKAKAYDEAVKKGVTAVKNLDKFGEHSIIVDAKSLRGLYVRLFPEIGVIDDETIRQEVTAYLKLSKEKANDYEKNMFNRWIDYFEREKTN